MKRCMKGYHIELELYVKSQRSYAEFEFCIKRLTGTDAPTNPITPDEQNMLDFADQVRGMTQSSVDLSDWMDCASREDQQRFINVAHEEAHRKVVLLQLIPWRKKRAKHSVEAPAQGQVQNIANLCRALGLRSSMDEDHVVTTSYLDRHYDAIMVRHKVYSFYLSQLNNITTVAQTAAEEVKALMKSTTAKKDLKHAESRARPRINALTDLLKPIFRYWNGAEFTATETKKTRSLQISHYRVMLSERLPDLFSPVLET